MDTTVVILYVSDKKAMAAHDEAVLRNEHLCVSPDSLHAKIFKGGMQNRKWQLGNPIIIEGAYALWTLDSIETGEMYSACQALVISANKPQWAARTYIDPSNRLSPPSKLEPTNALVTAISVANIIDSQVVRTAACITGFPIIIDTCEQVMPEIVNVIVVFGRCGSLLVDELNLFGIEVFSSMKDCVSKLPQSGRKLIVSDVLRRYARDIYLRDKSNPILRCSDGLLIGMPKLDLLYSTVFQIAYAVAVAEYNVGMHLIASNYMVHIIDADSLCTNLSKCTWAFRTPGKDPTKWFMLSPDQHCGIVITLECSTLCSIDSAQQQNFAGGTSDTVFNPSMKLNDKSGGAYNKLIENLCSNFCTVMDGLARAAKSTNKFPEKDILLSQFQINSKDSATAVPDDPSSKFSPVLQVLYRTFTMYAAKAQTGQIAILGVGNAEVLPSYDARVCKKCGKMRIDDCELVCDNAYSFFPHLETEPISGRTPAFPIKYNTRKQWIDALSSDAAPVKTPSSPKQIQEDRVKQVYTYAPAPTSPDAGTLSRVSPIDSPGSATLTERDSRHKANILLSPDGMPVNMYALSKRLLIIKSTDVRDDRTIIDACMASLISEAMVGHFIRKSIIAPGFSCGWAATFDHAFYAINAQRTFVNVMENIPNGTVWSVTQVNKTSVDLDGSMFNARLMNSEPCGRVLDNAVAEQIASSSLTSDYIDIVKWQKDPMQSSNLSLARVSYLNGQPLFGYATNYSRLIACTLFQVCHAFITGERLIGLSHYDTHTNNARYVVDASLYHYDWAFRCDAGWVIVLKESHKGLQMKFIDYGRARIDTMRALDACGYRRQSIYLGRSHELAEDLRYAKYEHCLPYSRLDPLHSNEVPSGHEDSELSYIPRRYIWSDTAINLPGKHPVVANLHHNYEHLAAYILDSSSDVALEYLDPVPQTMHPQDDSARVYPNMALLCKMIGAETIGRKLRSYAHLIDSYDTRTIINDSQVLNKRINELFTTYGTKIVQFYFEAFADMYEKHVYADMKHMSDTVFRYVDAKMRAWNNTYVTPEKHNNSIYPAMTKLIRWYIGNLFSLTKEITKCEDELVTTMSEWMNSLLQTDEQYASIVNPDIKSQTRSKTPTVQTDDEEYIRLYTSEKMRVKETCARPVKNVDAIIREVAVANATEEYEAKQDFDENEIMMDAAHLAASIILKPDDELPTYRYAPGTTTSRIAIVALGAHRRGNLAATLECARRDPAFATTLDHCADLNAPRCKVCNWRLLGCNQVLVEQGLCSRFCYHALQELNGKGPGSIILCDNLARFRTDEDPTVPLDMEVDEERGLPVITSVEKQLPLYTSSDGYRWRKVPDDQVKDMPRLPTYSTISQWRTAQKIQDYYLTKTDIS